MVPPTIVPLSDSDLLAPKNAASCEHLGFRRVVDAVEPGNGLRMWTFRRDPPAPRAGL